MLNNDEEMAKANFEKMSKLEAALADGKDDRRKVVALEKQCKLLEDKLRSRDPNDTALLMRAATAPAVDDGTKRELEQKVKKLEAEMELKEQIFEKKLRTLR